MNKITVTSDTSARMDDFYGIFFEDINHAADGGLYGELVRNRAFDFSPADNWSYHALTAWKKIEEGGAKVSVSASNKNPMSESSPNYLTLAVECTGTRAGIKNLGYNSGIPLRKDARYAFTCYARADKPCKIKVSADSAYGEPRMSGEIYVNSPEWTRYGLELTSHTDDFSASLALTADNKCKVCFAYVSLFPREVYKNRENGMRTDIAELLADLKPKFMRFPGGCLIHDGTLNSDDRNSMYRWKNTLGEVHKRPSRRNSWQYNQSLGLGYFEYFQFCEDIGAKPLPVLPAGYNPHTEQAAPLDEMREWIDDALDLIEFANGAPDSKWGAVRAQMGRREPFGLEYIAVGNEEVGQGFWDRYDLFHKALREKYPDIKIINSAGPFPSGGEFERGWRNALKNGSDFVDEHYYTSPEWMIANCDRYNGYSPDGPKVFLGEYASWGNTYYNALVEAAYMTCLENNARAVGLVCYAPLLANADYVNWQPDMIWFDNHRAYGSANYYVQKLFMNNTGNELLEIKTEGFENRVALGSDRISGGIELAADECGAEFYDIKITDLESGTVTDADPFFCREGGRRSIGVTAGSGYKIELTAKRVSGDKGFYLDFGKTDGNNFIRWFIGGRTNQDSEINARVNGRGSCLDHNVFSLSGGREYRLCLEVDGRGIKTYIDGTLMNTAVDRQPVMEEIYCTAGRDENYIYVKAVNIQDSETRARLCVDGVSDSKTRIYTLSGYEPDAENSFDEPKKISPRECETRMSGGMEYTFPPRSVTVFKIKR